MNYYLNGRPRAMLTVVSYTEFFILQVEAANVASTIAAAVDISVVQVPAGPSGPTVTFPAYSGTIQITPLTK